MQTNDKKFERKAIRYMANMCMVFTAISVTLLLTRAIGFMGIFIGLFGGERLGFYIKLLVLRAYNLDKNG